MRRRYFYCDERPRPDADRLRRWWGFRARCKSCGGEFVFSKQVTIKQRDRILKDTHLCTECEPEGKRNERSEYI
jgi:hypothetical protein